MAYLNEVRLIGNLTKDPEIKTLPKGDKVARVRIAVNRKFTRQDGSKGEEVGYFNCDFWGKAAEGVERFFKSGDPILVMGRLKFEEWDDKKTGEKRSAVGVFGENFQILKPYDGGSKREEQAPSRQKPDHIEQPAQRPAVPPRPAPQNAASSEDDDVPF